MEEGRKHEQTLEEEKSDIAEGNSEENLYNEAGRNELVEDDDEATTTTTKQNSIQKGKQGKVHHLDCKLSNAKTISCLKNSTTTLEFKS